MVQVSFTHITLIDYARTLNCHMHDSNYATFQTGRTYSAFLFWITQGFLNLLVFQRVTFNLAWKWRVNVSINLRKLLVMWKPQWWPWILATRMPIMAFYMHCFLLKVKHRNKKNENPGNTINVHFSRWKTKSQRLCGIALEVVVVTEMDLEEKFSLTIGWRARFTQIEFDIFSSIPK